MNNAIRKPTLLIENKSTADVFLAVKIMPPHLHQNHGQRFTAKPL
jgi:hypothetical protein